MVWADDRTADLIASNGLNDPTYICQAWCSTEQGLDVLLEELGLDSNSTGQASCCDGKACEPASMSGLVDWRTLVQANLMERYACTSLAFQET